MSKLNEIYSKISLEKYLESLENLLYKLALPEVKNPDINSYMEDCYKLNTRELKLVFLNRENLEIFKNFEHKLSNEGFVFDISRNGIKIFYSNFMENSFSVKKAINGDYGSSSIKSLLNIVDSDSIPSILEQKIICGQYVLGNYGKMVVAGGGGNVEFSMYMGDLRCDYCDAQGKTVCVDIPLTRIEHARLSVVFEKSGTKEQEESVLRMLKKN